MAPQKQLIYLQNKETGEIYYTRKNKKLVERKLKYKKYSRKLRKHVWFEEVKKPVKIKKASTKTKEVVKGVKVEKTTKVVKMAKAVKEKSEKKPKTEKIKTDKTKSKRKEK